MTTETIISALRAAREIVHTERTHLADAHMRPVTNQLDADGQAGVAEYDVVLRQIDDALAAATAGEKRDREADRARFSDPQFNRWLDEAITENGEFTVWDQIGDVCDAWHGWENRQFYAAQQPNRQGSRNLLDEFLEAAEKDGVTRLRIPVVPEPSAQQPEPTAPNDAHGLCAASVIGLASAIHRVREGKVEAAIEVIEKVRNGLIAHGHMLAAQQPVAVPEGFALPEHETPEMHDAVMAVLYTHGATRTGTNLLWQAYRSALLAAAPQAPSREPLTDEPLTWPKARDIARLEDMSPNGHLRLTFDSDNDLCVEVYDGKETFASVEFCNGGGGGGNSPHTRAALIAAMVAIEKDNAERPIRAHPRFSGITKEGGKP